MSSHGVKALERCLETRMNASAITFENQSVPRFVPRQQFDYPKQA
jgi:hypothetical protein